MNKPEIRKLADISLPKPKTTYLDNGIPVFSIDMGDSEVTKLDIIMEGGRCDETKPMLSEFTASLLREASKYHSPQEIAEQFDFYGAWIGCNTSAHNTVISIYSINKYFDNVIPYFSELIKYPAFPEQEFINAKNIAKSRLSTNNEKVSYLALSEFQKLYYGAQHCLGKKPTVENINNIGLEDVEFFHSKWHYPQNARILVSGKVTDSIINSINIHFGKTWESDFKATESAKDTPSIDFTPQTVTIDKPNALQCGIYMGIPTIHRTHPDYIPLRILITALGGYFGSRLMQNIREEKGYTYGISSILIGMRNNSSILISSQCDNSYTIPLINEIKTELLKLRDNPIPHEELEMVKSYMMSDLMKTTDTPFAVSEYYMAAISNNIPDDYFRNQVDCIRSITPSQLQDIAIKYLEPKHLLTVIAGDKRKIEY